MGNNNILKNNLKLLDLDNSNLFFTLKDPFNNLYDKNNPFKEIDKNFINDKKDYSNLIILTNGIGITLNFISNIKNDKLNNIFLLFFSFNYFNHFLNIIDLQNFEYNLSIFLLYENDNQIYKDKYIHKNYNQSQFTNNFPQKIEKINLKNKLISLFFSSKSNYINLINNNLHDTYFYSIKIVSEFVKNRPSVNKNNTIINKEFIKEITDLFKYKISSINSVLHFSKRWKQNLFKNLIYCYEKKINNFFSIKTFNTPILIFASSPNTDTFLSINKNILSKIKNVFTIFSLPSTYTLLKNYNLSPDFIFTFDGGFFNYYNFPKINESNFFTSFILYHSIFKNKFNRNVFLLNLQTPVENLIYKNINIPKINFAGSSVNMLLSYFLNFHKTIPIILVGSDYQNINRRSHHKFYELYNFQNRFNTFFKTCLNWETKVFITSSSKYQLYKNELEFIKRGTNLFLWQKEKNSAFLNYLNYLNTDDITKIKNNNINNNDIDFDVDYNNGYNYYNKNIGNNNGNKRNKYVIKKIDKNSIIKNAKYILNTIINIRNNIKYNHTFSNYTEYLNILTFLYPDKIIKQITSSKTINFNFLLYDLEKLIRWLNKLIS